MTQNLHQDADCRCMPIDEWPEVDRRLWQAALIPGDLFAEGGSRAKFTEITNHGIADHYGNWLQWLLRRGQLELTNSPGDRITVARVRAHLADLEQRCATQTVLNRLIGLLTAARVMDPHADWAGSVEWRGRSERGTGWHALSAREWWRPRSCSISVSA
jgi:hypothetical protein